MELLPGYDKWLTYNPKMEMSEPEEYYATIKVPAAVYDAFKDTMNEGYCVEGMKPYEDIAYEAEFTDANLAISARALLLNGSDYDELGPCVILSIIVNDQERASLEFDSLPIEQIYEYEGCLYNVTVERGD